MLRFTPLPQVGAMVFLLIAGVSEAWAVGAEATVRAVKSGDWSDGKIWSGGHLPKSGDRVLIGKGMRVKYDVVSKEVIYSVHVAGRLDFARDRDTALHVGVLKVSPGADARTVEDVHHHHGPLPGGGGTGAALTVGTLDHPIVRGKRAEIVLHYLEGMNKKNAPAIIARPGGRMTFAGAVMSRTWVKLGKTAKVGDKMIELAEEVKGWGVGDEIIVTGSKKQYRPRGKKYYDHQPVETEKRVIQGIKGKTIALDKALKKEHWGKGNYRSEVANLSRNVVVRSADPKGVRGHTMYHRYAGGSISYARFAGLGKKNTLGRYPIHFHLVRDTMRGSSVIGAAVVDSHNRWVTVHGTQYLVVRDTVGYQSYGHGFFLEDGTEVYNVLDRNLGVQAFNGPRMKGMALPFDPNDGAAFWWANGKNTFTRNVACENFRYGYRYDSQKRSNFDSNLMIRTEDGKRKKVDIRRIPIFKFEDNESHTEGLYSFAFAGTEGVGPDVRHPHRLGRLKAWETHYALRVGLPTMLIEDVDIEGAAYGVYRPWFKDHVYRNIRIAATGAEPFNRGMDDRSEQHGRITVDGLRFEKLSYGGQMPLIQISDNNLSGDAESHFRNVKVLGRKDARRWPLVNRGGGARVEPRTARGVPVYLHDYFGAGRDAKVSSVKAKDFGGESGGYKSYPGLTGRDARVAELKGVKFPKLLDPVDDEAPATIVTWPNVEKGGVVKIRGGKLRIEGTATDNGKVVKVLVNGKDAKSLEYGYGKWAVELSGLKAGKFEIKAYGMDEAGNVEKTAHVMRMKLVE